MRKKEEKRELVLIKITVLVILFLLLFYKISFDITGFVPANISITIDETIDGDITAFDYMRSLNLTQIQNITVEFTNTGTSAYNTTITEKIYIYEGGNLNFTQEFFDYTIPLFPGMRRHFRTSYKPPRVGTYYIKVLATYGSRRLETWGVFRVQVPGEGNVTEPGPEGPPPGPGGETYTPLTIIKAGRPRLDVDLDYPTSVNLYQGQTVMVGLKVNNTGNTTLRRLRLHVSTPQEIDVTVDPKEVYDLFSNDTSVFLLSIHAQEDAQVGIHVINFDLVSDRLKESGVIQVNVTPYRISLEREIQDRILNNRYLIVELERQFLTAFKRGISTTVAEVFLNAAKIHLDAAEEYLNIAELENAIKELDKKDKNLKKAVFELAHESFRVYYPPAFSPIWILLLMILLGVIIFIILERKKKKKKPRLLRGEEESEV